MNEKSYDEPLEDSCPEMEEVDKPDEFSGVMLDVSIGETLEAWGLYNYYPLHTSPTLEHQLNHMRVAHKIGKVYRAKEIDIGPAIWRWIKNQKEKEDGK